MFKKRILLLIMVITSAVLISACASGDPLAAKNTTTTSVEKETKIEINMEDYDNSLEGLEGYLKAQEYINKDKVEMNAGLIGAKKGYRWSFDANDGKTVLEIYEYDSEKLTEQGKKILKQVKETGKFKLYNMPEVDASLLNNERFLLVYKDTKLEESNPANNVIKRKEDILNAIDTFYAENDISTVVTTKANDTVTTISE